VACNGHAALWSRRAGEALKIVIPGGSGQVGQLLARTFKRHDHQVVVLGRQASAGVMAWDGQSLGDWAQELDGADVVINLAGRSVNCRYTAANMKDMMESRVNSTRVVGQAIELATVPPRVWLQMSTATIYAHRFDAANDEVTGIIGGNEPEVPAYWGYSIQIAQAWEKALDEANTPRTRKVALRTAMVMSADRGGIFDVLLKLVRTGLGGSMAGGKQYMSWIHGDDFVTAVDWLIAHDEVAGAINLAAPEPLPQAAFMRDLRKAAGVSIGLPATKWMAQVGAYFLRTDTELTLKSRRVVPKRLLDAGFKFAFPSWPKAADDLMRRWRAKT